MSKNIIIIYGAPGSGKTRRAEQLRRHYGGKRVIDGWDGGSGLHPGDIALTNLQPPFCQSGARAIPIEKAKAAITTRKRVSTARIAR